MQITFFGALWILLILYCFFSNDHRKMLFLALFSMIFQSNNIVYFGETGIGTQVFTIGIAWVRFLLVKPATTRLKEAGPIRLFSATLICVVLLSLWHNDSLVSNRLVAFTMLLVYIAFMWLLARKNVRIDAKWLEKTEDFIIVTVLIVGVLQVLCKSGLSFLTGPLRLFIYNDVNNENVIFSYKETARFYSTFMEPSYCGAFLVGAFALVSVRNDLTRKNVILALAIGFAILMTRSSVAFGGLAIIVCLLLITRGKRKVFKFIVPAGIVIGLFVAVFNMDLLNEVIFDKGASGSAIVRNNWNNRAIKAFKESPLFGAGYGSKRASSLFLTMLAETGIMGCAVYVFHTLHQLKCAVFEKRYSEAKGRSYFILGIIICQFIACPDLSFSPFWLGLYLLVLSMRAEKNSL